MVTRLIESAQTQPVDVDLDPQPRREITRTVKVVMRQARSLPVAAALAMIVAAFLVGVVLGDRRETSPVAPIMVPSPALAGAVGAEPPEPGPTVASAPAAAPIATAETGFDLRVSPPGARVVLDGRAIGSAPLRVRNLTAGEHVIELEADGYFARRLTVSLERDAPQSLSIALDRLGPEPEAAPEPRQKRERPPQPVRAEKGTLKIGSKPPCEVVINGRSFGNTPRFIKLDAGRHRVKLVNSTYSISERIGVDIKAGETIKVLRDYSDVLESSAGR